MHSKVWSGNAGMVTSEHAQLKAAAHSNNTDNAALERIREFSIGKLEMGRWLTPIAAAVASSGGGSSSSTPSCHCGSAL